MAVDLEMEFRDGVSLRRQLEDALRVAIRSGRLPPGSALPPSRDLAEQLSVSRGVVVDSYAQLTTEGYLSARRGSGTRVAATAASGRPPARRQLPAPNAYRYELRPGLADFHAFPRAAWKAALLRALRELPDSRLTYADHRGVPKLRNALAGYLARVRGVVVDPEHVVVCCAASQALTVLWHVLRNRGGRRVAVEDPGWRWQRYTAEAARLEAVPIRVDADGMVVSELAAADVDAVVMTPAHHYPTGVVMTAERRGALIAWARDRGALIVEDDYDVEYRFGRIGGLASGPGTGPVRVRRHRQQDLAPALRLAWVVPPSHLIDDAEDVLLVTGVTPPPWTRRPWRRSSRTPRWNATCAPCAGATAPSEPLGRRARQAPARGSRQRHRGRAAPARLAPRGRGRARDGEAGPALRRRPARAPPPLHHVRAARRSFSASPSRANRT